MSAAGPLALGDLDVDTEGEPRVSHRRLADALGFSSPHKLGHLIERHRLALTRFGEVSSTMDETKAQAAVRLGEVCRTVRQTSAKGGRPGRTYWLTKRQALFICTKSETPRATEATIEMVEVFDAYLLGTLRTVHVREHDRRPPRPRPVGLRAALAHHAEVSREADASLSLRARDVERWARREGAAVAALDEALTHITSPDDVAAVLEHAYHQGGREAEPGAQVMVLHRLVAALTMRAFGREALTLAA